MTKTLPIGSSQAEMRRAREVIASGLSSYARMRDHQVVFERAKGAYLWDIDGNRYIDCVCAHGPVFLGHAPSVVSKAVAGSINDGFLFGGPHRDETELAELVLEMLPWASKMAYVNTGSEAVQLALRVARVTTGRRRIVKFDGHYHGWIDPLYVNSPGVNPLVDTTSLNAETTSRRAVGQLPTVPNVAGQAPSEDVIVAEWNNIDRFRQLMEDIGPTVAAVILEPIASNFGTFKPSPGFLETLREISHEHGALVVFDEVVSGFRMAAGGAAELLGVTPDLAAYAKAFGSGFPIAMVAGTAQAMEVLENGMVLTAGTYSGTPASVRSSIATLTEINRQGPALYERLDRLGERLRDGFEAAGRDLGVPIHVNQIGSLAQVLYGDMDRFDTIAAVNESNKAAVVEICEDMITRGIYASRKGLFYLNAAHTDADIDTVISAFRESLAAHVK